MPRDFLPAIYPNDGHTVKSPDEDNATMNMQGIILNNSKFGVMPRNEVFKDSSFTANNAADRGRGITSFAGEDELHLDQDTYYYNGGSQDLTATSAPGYANNTGFNDDYVASFVRHNVSGVENLVIVNAGDTSTNASATHGNIWYVADGATAPSSVSSSNLPCNNATAGDRVSITRGGASLDGYFFVADIEGKIYNSNLNDITTWTATDFLTAEREPDVGIYLGKHHDNIVYIGTRSIEFFYNAGNPDGSPLARRQDVSYRVGCYYPNSIVENGDEIFFLGTTESGDCAIYLLKNFQLTQISDVKINNRLRDFSVGDGINPDITSLVTGVGFERGCWGARVEAVHSKGYIFTFQTNFTYFWDEDLNIWFPWEFTTTPTYTGNLGNWANIFPIVSSNSNGSETSHQFINGEYGKFTSGGDVDAINDLNESNAANVWVKFALWDAGTDKKKRVKAVRVVCEPRLSSVSVYSPLDATFRFVKYDRLINAIAPPNTGYGTDRDIALDVRGGRLFRFGTGRAWSFLLDFPVGHGEVTTIIGIEIDYEVVGE